MIEYFQSPSHTSLTIQKELEQLFRLDDEDAGEVLLVRHAQPAVECGAPITDDSLLSCLGLTQAECLAERLRSLWFEAIYTAPERRALQTAAVISEATDRPVVVLDDLHDIEYFTPAQGDPSRLHATANFLDDPRWDSVPGFTPGKAFRHRAVRTIGDVLAGHQGRRAVIVTHASLINAYVGSVFGIPRDLFCAPDHASISTVRSLDGQQAVRVLNDTAHLTCLAGIPVL